MLEFSMREFLDRWSFALLGVALIVVAALVNRFAADRRPALRRLLVLFLLYLFSHGAALGFDDLGAGSWGHALHAIGAVLKALLMVGLCSTMVFDVICPVLRVRVSPITSEASTGIAYVIAAVVAMRGIGMEVSSVIATSAVVSAVLALSLQTTLGSALGGFVLQIDGSFEVGDWLQLDNGKQGKVVAIRWRHTVLETRDWDTMVVPNSMLLAEMFTVLGKRTGQPCLHRMWVYFHVDFRYSPQQVIEVVDAALQAAPIPNVAVDPAPHAICSDFAKENRESFAVYAVRYWLTDLALDDPTSSVVRARIYSALRRADIPLARPAQTLFMVPDGDSEEARRAERHLERRTEALRSQPLFASLTEDELGHLAQRLRQAPFAAGETITRQGARANWLYILGRGRVKIEASRAGERPRVVAELSAPNIFGEMGLLTGEPRAASVVALTPVECWRLDKEAFAKIIEERPEIADHLSSTLEERQQDLSEDLAVPSRRVPEAGANERMSRRIREFFGLE